MPSRTDLRCRKWWINFWRCQNRRPMCTLITCSINDIPYYTDFWSTATSIWNTWCHCSTWRGFDLAPSGTARCNSFQITKCRRIWRQSDLQVRHPIDSHSIPWSIRSNALVDVAFICGELDVSLIWRTFAVTRARRGDHFGWPPKLWIILDSLMFPSRYSSPLYWTTDRAMSLKWTVYCPCLFRVSPKNWWRGACPVARLLPPTWAVRRCLRFEAMVTLIQNRDIYSVSQKWSISFCHSHQASLKLITWV